MSGTITGTIPLGDSTLSLGGVTIRGANFVGPGTLQTGGMVAVVLGAELSNGAVWDNIGTVNVISGQIGTGPLTNEASGLLLFTTGANPLLVSALTNKGTIETNGAGLSVLSPPIDDTGTIIIPGGTLEVAKGTFDGPIQGAGLLQFGGPTTILSGFSHVGPLEFYSGSASLLLNGTTTTLNGVVSFAGAEIVGPGSLVTTGTVTVYGIPDESGYWSNTGTLDIAGGQIGLLGTIANQVGALLDLTSDTNPFTGGTVINDGTLMASPAVNTVFQASIVDTGNIDIGSGTLQFYGGGTISGSVLGPGSLALTNGVLYTLTASAYLDPASVTIGSPVHMQGAGILSDNITINSNGRVTGYGSLNTITGNNGIIEASSGKLTVNQIESGTGSIYIDSASTLDVFGQITNTTINFNKTSNGTLILRDPADFTGTVTGVQPGDIIDFPKATVASIEQTASGWAVLFNNAGTADPETQLTGALAGAIPILSSASTGGTSLTFVLNEPVVKIEGTFPTGGPEVGSGFIIGPHSILTAAHVIYRSSTGDLAQGVTVFAGATAARLTSGTVPPFNGSSVPLNTSEFISNPSTGFGIGFNVLGPPTGTLLNPLSLAYDYAVIDTPTDLTRYGSIAIQPNDSGTPPPNFDLEGYPNPGTSSISYLLYGAESAGSISGGLLYYQPPLVPNPFNTPPLPLPVSIGMSGGPALTDTPDSIQAFGIISTTGHAVLITSSVNSAIAGWEASAPCFAAGTHIATPFGELPVEHLRAGDQVQTARGDSAPIIWIGSRSIDCSRHPDPATVAPVKIERGAFTENCPHRDLWLSPDHAIFIDGKLICARQLINGATIHQSDRHTHVRYYHIELQTHSILFAENLPAESYLNTGNRGFFGNSQSPTVLHPDLFEECDHPTRETASCAPFVWDEASVRPVWQRLAQRAASLGRPVPQHALTTDPDVRLLISDRSIRPAHNDGHSLQFVIPRNATGFRVLSRAQRPTVARPWIEDRRQLGICVARVILRGSDLVHDIPIDHPGFTEGWWAIERDGSAPRRWTNGNAVLPMPEQDSDAVLTIHLAGEMIYATGSSIDLLRPAA